MVRVLGRCRLKVQFRFRFEPKRLHLGVVKLWCWKPPERSVVIGFDALSSSLAHVSKDPLVHR